MGFTITGGMRFSGGGMLASPAQAVLDPYFNYTTLLLPGNGTNNGTNNTFIDGSTNNFTITRNGNTTQGTFSPFSLVSYSNYFDGTGDYLNTPANAAFTFGTGDLTLECWIYQTATSTSTYRVIFGDNVYGSAGGYTLYSYNNGLNLWKGSAGGGTEVIAPAGTINLNTWTHVAWTRSGSSNRLFINGTQVGATTTDSTNFTSTAIYIAASRLGTFAFAGYISNARALKGTALYTSNFTPSTAPLTAIANTSLLTCQSNRFIDNSTNNFTITRSGDTSVQSFSPFNPTSAYSTNTNGGSAYFDGTGDYLTVPAGSAFAYGTADFTIEGWFYATATPPSYGMTLFAQTTTGTNYLWVITGDGTPSTTNVVGVGFALSGGGTFASSSTTYNLNSWNHFAIVRSSSNIKVYLNGVGGTAVSCTQNFTDTTYVPTIGRYSHSEANQFTGYMSSFRIVKGTAVYTANFTPPTAPLTAIANTSLLCNFTNGQITDATVINDLETVGGAKVSTTISKWGGSSMLFDGVNSYLSMKDNINLDLGSADFTIEFWIYFNTFTDGKVVLSKGWVAIAAAPFLFYTDGVLNKLSFYASSNGTSWDIASQLTVISSPSTGQWYHVAVTRSGSTFRTFTNGTQVATVTISSALLSTTQPVTVGASPTAANFGNFYMNDLRITKGYARYTSNFTAPTAAFPTY